MSLVGVALRGHPSVDFVQAVKVFLIDVSVDAGALECVR